VAWVDRYCRNCGDELNPDDRFCPSCGRPVHQTAHVPTPEADVPVPPTPSVPDAHTRDILEPARQRPAGYALPHILRFPDPGRDTLLGLLLAVACAGLLVAALYALLAIRGTFSDPSVPRTIGLALFALMHGGAASVDVPPIPSLLGLGGSLRIGLPITSFALLPFFASLLGARFVAQRARTPALFILVVTVAYALVVAAFAALGAPPPSRVA
jgi:hypothetical protein